MMNHFVKLYEHHFNRSLVRHPCCYVLSLVHEV